MIEFIYAYYLYRHFKFTHFTQSSCILTETFRVSDQSCTGLFESTYTYDRIRVPRIQLEFSDSLLG